MTGKPSHKKPLIVILGPTAIGKTGLAIQLAHAISGEIIGADSRQIYRFMDIGTAKPTQTEREKATHHLIDLINPDDSLTLARYQELTYNTINAIHQRGHIPLLVGGTGQYISAVTEGWSIPEVPPNEALRTELEAFAELEGAQALYNRLNRVDPEAAEKIHPNNVRRVVRALEVYMETGELISELQRKKPPSYIIMELGLTMERSILYQQADYRVDKMLDAGFLDEVQDLLERGYSRRLPAMTGLGYKQLSEHLVDGVSLAEAIEATKIATHRFIRRQYTWFRGHDNGIIWYDVTQTSSESIIDDCKAWLTTQCAI